MKKYRALRRVKLKSGEINKNMILWVGDHGNICNKYSMDVVVDPYNLTLLKELFKSPVFFEEVKEEWRAFKDEEISEAWEFLRLKDIRWREYTDLIEIVTFKGGAVLVAGKHLDILYSDYEVEINGKWQPIGKRVEV